MEGHGDEGAKFEVAFRGYHRQSVDDYVAGLHRSLLESQERADNALKHATTSVGVEVNDILRKALEAGEHARQEMEREAATLVEQSQRSAEAVVQAAESRAQELKDRADGLVRDAQGIKAAALAQQQVEFERRQEDTRRQCETLQSYIDDLAEFKTKALDELTRLKQHLVSDPDVPMEYPDTLARDSAPPPAPKRVEVNGSDGVPARRDFLGGTSPSVSPFPPPNPAEGPSR